MQFRLMTYNINGHPFGPNREAEARLVRQVIDEVGPDILAIQEAAEYQDAEGAWHAGYRGLLGGAAARAGMGMAQEEQVYFGPSISLREHLHTGKELFIEGLFNDWLDWRKGNALLSRWPFVRLGDPEKPGTLRQVPLFRPPVYEGNRDTEPRYALLTRVGRSPIFPYVANVHLTTLVGERGMGESVGLRARGPSAESDTGPLTAARYRGRSEEAEALRFRQAKRILDLLRARVLERGELVFLMGDFNATPGEAAISAVLEGEGRFVRLEPEGAGATHQGTSEPIDHLFVYPAERLVESRCWIVDSPAARQASDHLPVVADVTVQ